MIATSFFVRLKGWLKFGLILALLGVAYPLVGQNRQAHGAASTNAPRSIILRLPVGLVGSTFWVYIDGRLVGTDKTLRVQQTALEMNPITVQSPTTIRVLDHTGALIAYLPIDVKPMMLMDVNGLSGRLYESVSVDVPPGLASLDVLYGGQVRPLNEFPLWLGQGHALRGAVKDSVITDGLPAGWAGKIEAVFAPRAFGDRTSQNWRKPSALKPL